MKKIILTILVAAGLYLVGSAQITKTEYDKMWAATIITDNAGTADADQKKANALISLMETKYPKDASVILTRGVYYYYFLDDQNKALTAFSKAITTKPGYALAYIYRAKVLAKKGVFEKAIEDLNIVIEKESNNLQAIRERADDYFQIKDYESALSDYRAYLKLQPGSGVAYSDVANTLKALGKKDEAAAIFIDALKTKAADSTTLHALYGKYLLGENKYDEASAEYSKAFNGDKTLLYADDYNSAGIAAYKKKYLENALYYFKMAQRLNPINISYYDNAASVNFDNKNYDNIIREAMSMLRLDPDNPKANKWMSIGLDKSNRNSSYAIYNLRAGDLETKGSTTLQIIDSILYFVPKEREAYTRHVSTVEYKEAFSRYLPDYNSLPGQNWVTAFSNSFSNDGELSTEDIHGENVKRTYAGNKLKVEILKTGSVAESSNTTGIYKVSSDVCYTAEYTVLSSDSNAVSGLDIYNYNGVSYYFLINPVTKRYYVAYRQNGIKNLYHGLGDEGNEDIPDVGVPLHWKIIMQNLELAFIINNKIIAAFPLQKFTEINTVKNVGIHVEGKTTVEINSLTAASSPTVKNNTELAALNWNGFNNKGYSGGTNNGNTNNGNTGNNPRRELYGTMILWQDSKYSTKPFAEVFEIWGDPFTDVKIIYAMMVLKCNSDYTYTNYTWKRTESAYTVTKGWDLRDFENKGTYFTNGVKVQ